MAPTVNTTLPPVGIVTVRWPVLTPYSPLCATVTLTASDADGTGLALRVKLALPPPSPHYRR